MDSARALPFRASPPCRRLCRPLETSRRRWRSNGALDIIYDPNTTRPDPSRPGNYIRDPFPGNIVPNGRINPVSKAVLPYWPSPNRPGQGPTQFNNYFVSGKSINIADTYLGRIDHCHQPERAALRAI